MATVWTKDMLLERLALGEDSRVEFKEAYFKGGRVEAPRRETMADELAALGNTLGGTVILSVSDNGEVRPLDREGLDRLESFIGEVCADSIRPPLAFITQRLALPDGSVLVVEIARSEPVHRSPGGYLHRQGSSKRELSPEALHRLFQQRGRAGLRGPDEAIVDGTGPRTLDPDLSGRFLSSRSDEPPEDQLVKLGLLGLDGASVVRATVAGTLLCTRQPDDYLRGAVIEAVRYRGTVQGRAEQHDAMTISGPLDDQIRQATRFARLNTRVSARRTPGLVEMHQFSPRAVFEAVVNAVAHRDYSMENTKTRLFIFDDRLELYSPGALPNTLPIGAMRHRQVTRNETIASMLRLIAIGDVPGAGDRRYFLQQRGEGVPIIYEQTRALTGSDPTYELLSGAELRLTIPAAPPPMDGIAGSVIVRARGRPLPGATVVAHYPNGTWMAEVTDTFGRVGFGFHSELPITVLCAAPGFGGHVERRWRPPQELSVDLPELPGGGSAVFTEGTGNLPGLTGRLNPILDTLDRTYLYTTNVAIDGGKHQPVYFRLGQPLLLTDVNGCRLQVRFIEMLGKSALVEYQSREATGKVR
ncbi:MAG: putative DNA binding domain-containing protein [bacterium]|nr:putative DNA binding domain-containing protein [bacterium]